MRGIHSMLVTPFQPDGPLDLPSLRHLISFIATTGAQGVAILGVLGEYQKLDDSERLEVLETAAEALAETHLRLTVGVSHGGARVAAHFAACAQMAGAHAVMLAPPPILAPGPALLDFIQRVAEAVSIPVVLQDYPPATGVVMPVSFLAQVAERVPNVRAIKCEDAPTSRKMALIQDAVGQRFSLLGGLGGLYFLEELRQGATGTLTGFAYPEVLRSIYTAHQRGDQQRAAEIFAAFLPLIRLEAQAGIGLGLRKELLQRRGAIAHAALRAPSTALDRTTLQELDFWLTYLKEHSLTEDLLIP